MYRHAGHAWGHAGVDEVAADLGWTFDQAHERIHELAQRYLVDSFDTRPSYQLTTGDRDVAERLILEGAGDDALRDVVRRWQEGRTQVLAAIYEACHRSTAEQMLVDESLFASLGLERDVAWEHVNWLVDHDRLGQVGHYVSLTPAGVDIMERAASEPAVAPEPGLGPLNIAVTVLYDSPGAQVMQNSPGGSQVSVSVRREAGELLALVAEVRGRLDDLRAEQHAVAAANLAMIEAQATAGSHDSDLVRGALRQIVDFARETGAHVLAGLILKFLGGPS